MAIGKTRQQKYDAAVGPARGVLLHTAGAANRIEHTRRSPAPELLPWIAHYWSVQWDLRGSDPHRAETVPHPNVHLVFESGKAATVNGVQTKKFSTTLEGRSKVFGVKFRPGGFRAFYPAPISKLANRTVDARTVFGETVTGLRAKSLNQFFTALQPKPDPAATLAGDLVDQILHDAALRKVEELARHAGLSQRSLQRLFSEYVGASPKWVIRRYRLHEALERLHAFEPAAMAELAVELGYFDQAHLIQDFKAIIGMTPGQYQAAAAVTPPLAPAPTSLPKPGL